jgi:hypothetical protein
VGNYNKNKKKINPIPDNSVNICASDFNLYFTGIAEKLVKTIPVQQPETNFQNYLSNITRPQDDFNFKEISYNDVRDAILCIFSRSLMSLNIEKEHTQVQIFTWFTANKLVVNKDKTQSIIFSLREIGENSKTIKLLGIHLDTKMTWEAHADHLLKTISKKLFVLRQLRSEVNVKTLLTAYHALVHSNITYAILVWGHSTHLCKVFNQQRKCIRVLGGLGYRDDCRDMFKTLKILRPIL